MSSVNVSSKKEEERNEKIIRGLLKLPPNRRCINCNSLGPQYVCTSFWTFICISCSGIHREFTHRVKSVSMAKFTTQEVEALQKGGNQRARELYLKDLDPQQMRLPDSSNVDNLREFIKAVYVEKRYAGGRFSEKPPRDLQNHKSHEEHRRASSYHSYSQSPPYDYQYEERLYGKQATVLTRKPGSDRGHYEGKNFSSSASSPGSQHEQMSEDKFAHDVGPRLSSCSGLSIGDPFRTGCSSPSFQEAAYSSPPAQESMDTVNINAKAQTWIAFAEPNTRISAGITHSQGTVSSGSIASTDSSSWKSASSCSLGDLLLEPEQVHKNKQNENLAPPISAKFCAAANGANLDLFDAPVEHQKRFVALEPPSDLFFDISFQPVTPLTGEMVCAAPSSDNAGWATFDSPPEKPLSRVPETTAFTAFNKAMQNGANHLLATVPNSSTSLPSFMTPDLFSDQFSLPSSEVKESIDTNSPQLWSAFDDASTEIQQNSLENAPVINSDSQEPKRSVDENSAQLWHPFDDITEAVPHESYGGPAQSSERQNPVHMSLAKSNPFASCEVSCNDSTQKFMDEAVSSSAPFIAFPEPFSSSVIPSVLQGGISKDQKSLNPFDLPFDSDSEGLNFVQLMDMSTLQQAMPNPELPAAYIDNLSETWFPHDAAARTFLPVSHGALPFFAEQVSSSPLQNITPNPVSTLSGNPFA